MSNIHVSIGLLFSKKTKSNNNEEVVIDQEDSKEGISKKVFYFLKEETFANLYLIYRSYLGKIFELLACMQESSSCKNFRYSEFIKVNSRVKIFFPLTF